MTISLSDGNAKLVKTSGEVYRVIGYGIPAHYSFDGMNTCPGARDCVAVCYALQGRYIMPNVMSAKLRNLEASLLDTFVGDMIAELKRRRSYNVVRIHDAGDFYNQEYYNKWCDIARAMPDRIFYAYTKAFNLDLYTNKPQNLRIIQSLGGKYDKLVNLNQPHSRIFSSDEARIAAGYEDGNISDLPAIEGVVKIGLVFHGTRKLTLAQIKHFS